MSRNHRDRARDAHRYHGAVVDPLARSGVERNVVGQTQTATLLVESQYHAFEQQSAYAISFVLAFVSVAVAAIPVRRRAAEPDVATPVTPRG